MRTVLKAVGYVIFFGAGVWMWVYAMIWFNRWWGSGGLVIAIFVPPVGELFPFIYWFKESFPSSYFVIWGVGLLGILLASFARPSENY